jgi:hypothetical protein
MAGGINGAHLINTRLQEPTCREFDLDEKQVLDSLKIVN